MQSECHVFVFGKTIVDIASDSRFPGMRNQPRISDERNQDRPRSEPGGYLPASPPPQRGNLVAPIEGVATDSTKLLRQLEYAFEQL